MVVVGDVKIYGVCFGAQILAEALGGQVGKNVCAIPFVLQREIVTVTEAMKRRPDYVAAVRLIPPNACGQLSKNKASEQKLAMIQSHGDYVTQLPSSATLLGTSPTAPHEIWALGEDVLAVQGHPELDRDSALTKILPHVRALTEDAAAFAKSSLRLEVDHVTLIGMVRGFLRGCDGLMVGDTAEVVARHVEACRLVLSDTAAPRVHAASQNVSVASSTVDSGAAAAAGAGAASVGSVCGTNGTATSPKSQNNNVSRLAKSSTGEETETDREKYQDPRETNRALRVAAEEVRVGPFPNPASLCRRLSASNYSYTLRKTDTFFYLSQGFRRRGARGEGGHRGRESRVLHVGQAERTGFGEVRRTGGNRGRARRVRGFVTAERRKRIAVVRRFGRRRAKPNGAGGNRGYTGTRGGPA